MVRNAVRAPSAHHVECRMAAHGSCRPRLRRGNGRSIRTRARSIVPRTAGPFAKQTFAKQTFTKQSGAQAGARRPPARVDANRGLGALGLVCVDLRGFPLLLPWLRISLRSQTHDAETRFVLSLPRIVDAQASRLGVRNRALRGDYA